MSEAPEWVREDQPTRYGEGEPFATPAAYASSEPNRCPTYDGGVQVEWHRDGWDVEIEFDRDGTLQSVWCGRSSRVNGELRS